MTAALAELTVGRLIMIFILSAFSEMAVNHAENKYMVTLVNHASLKLRTLPASITFSLPLLNSDCQPRLRNLFSPLPADRYTVAVSTQAGVVSCPPGNSTRAEFGNFQP